MKNVFILILVFQCCFYGYCQDIDFGKAMKPVPLTAKLEEKDYFVWGASPIKGDDGLYHLFYSRWKKEYGFNAWVTHSEIAHAVSENLFGPYKFKNVALSARDKKYWDGTTTHNPTVHKFNGKYYLYYMGNCGDGRNIKDNLNWTHRNTQRIGVAVTSDLNGKWERCEKPLIDVSSDSTYSDCLLTSNPSITETPGGKYILIYKGVGLKHSLPFGGPVVHLAATSDSPIGPFVKEYKEIFTVKGSMFPAEDPYIWLQGKMFYAIVKDMNGEFTGIGRSLALFESKNGIDWVKSRKILVSGLDIIWENGYKQKVNNLERPQLYIENGIPKALFVAVSPDSNFSHTFNVHIPLDFSK